MQKIKSIAFVGIFLFLLLGMSFMKPSPAAAAAETVTTHIVYQSSSVNTEVTYQTEAVSNSDIETETDFPETDSVQDDEGAAGNEKVWSSWFEKIKKIVMIGCGFAWSG